MLPQGTGVGLYGYKWDKDQKKRVPLGFETKVVERVFTMIAEGVSRFKVAKTLNDQGVPTKSGGKWHPLTIKRMVTNPAYIGLTYFGRNRGSKKTSLQPQPQQEWKLLPDVTPPIISKELFEQVQKVLERSKESRPGRPLHDYLLTGHIICGYCHSPLIGSCLNHRYRYYRCRGAYETASRGPICNARYIRADSLEEIVWNKVREVLEDPKIVLGELHRQAKAEQHKAGEGLSLDKEIARLQRKLRSYDAQQKRLVKLFRHGEVTEDYILDEMNQLKKDREEDEQHLCRLRETKEQLAKLATAEIKLNDFCARVRQNLADCSIEDKRLALDALDIKVVATQDHIEINGAIPIDLTATPTSEGFSSTEQTWA